MTSSLPPKASLEQLRNQAKDLLRAQKAGDPSCCDVLRKLKRFADAGDEEILAAKVPLKGAQFALAMDYGFKSWKDLKDHLDALPPAAGGATLKRDGGRMWIDGVDTLAFMTGKQHAFMGALEAAMHAIGQEDVTYDYLMGVSGAAFRLQVDAQLRRPDPTDCNLGFDCTAVAMTALGYAPLWHSVAPDDSAGVTETTRAIVKSIEKGVPAVVQLEHGAWGLFVGYVDEGEELLCRNYDGKKAYSPLQQWSSAVMIIGEKSPAPPRADSIRGSLRLAATLAHTKEQGEFVSGLAAYESWISDLRNGFGPDESVCPWGPPLGNCECYASLTDARAAAGRYLLSIAGEMSPRAAEHLREAAPLCERVAARLREDAGNVPAPWDITPEAPWPQEMRDRQADALTEALALERRAVAEIEKALAAME